MRFFTALQIFQEKVEISSTHVSASFDTFFVLLPNNKKDN